MDEWYGGRPQLPPREALVGQDLIRDHHQLNRLIQSGLPVSEGHSTPLMLCIVDPRLFPRGSDAFTRELQRLYQEIPGSRTVDRCMKRHAVSERSAIGGTLVQLHYGQLYRHQRHGGQHEKVP